MDDLTGVIEIRPAKWEDRAYIIKTWLSTYAHSPVARAFGAPYYRAWSGVVEVQYGSAKEVRVACLRSEPDAVVGFAVLGREGGFRAIHYVCVRASWRQKGVARLLLGDIAAEKDVVYTHTPPPELKEKIPVQWRYEPRLTHKIEE